MLRRTAFLGKGVKPPIGAPIIYHKIIFSLSTTVHLNELLDESSGLNYLPWFLIALFSVVF